MSCDINFVSIGRNKVESVYNFTLEQASFILWIHNEKVKGKNFTCHQQNNLESALEFVETNAMIVNSSFIHNTVFKFYEHDFLSMWEVKFSLLRVM